MEHIGQTEKSNDKNILLERVTFLFVAVGVMSLTYIIFFFFDFLPEKSEQVAENSTPQEERVADEEVAEVEVAPLPVSIIFDSLGGKEVKVLNPEEGSIEALDTALLSGVVRHPDSADFKNTGTIFILGHSSYLPNVMNKNFQAFNGIQKLQWGDTVRLRSNNTEYVYSVERVYEAKAADAEVEIEMGTSKLVLATCNSFATKDDRYVVEAVLVGAHPIAE